MTELNANPPEVPLDGPPVTGDPNQPVLPVTPDDERALHDASVPNERGERVVPLQALREARSALKDLKASNATLQQQVAQLAPLQEKWAQVEPLLPFLAVAAAQAANGTLGQPPQPTQPAVHPKVQAMAARLKISVDDAQALYETVRDITGEEVSTRVEPLTRSVATVKAQTMMERAMGVKDVQGQPYAPPQAIQQVYQALMQTNPQLAESEDVAKLVLVIARGMGSGQPQGRPGGPVGSEPNVSEAPGLRLGAAANLTGLDLHAAQVRGISVDRMRQLRSIDSDVLE